MVNPAPFVNIISFGIWPAVPLTGNFIVNRYRLGGIIQFIPPITYFSLITATGLAFWSFFLLSSAMAGVYRADYFGLIGWFITLYFLKRNFKKWHFSFGENLRVSGWDGLFAMGLVFTAWIYIGFPAETIFLGCDEGLYTNHGIFIANHGRMDVPYPWPENLNHIFSKVFREIPGFYPTPPTLTVQFPHTFPVWLAQAFATFGHHGLFRLNAIFALLSITVFYGFCRSLLQKPYAVFAALFLALNPGQIWLARRTLTEIPSQFIIWSAFLVLFFAQQNKHRLWARWAGVLLGFSLFVRIDNFLLIPLLFFSHLMQKVIVGQKEEMALTVWSPFYQVAMCLAILAVIYYFFDTKKYFLDNLPNLKWLGILTLATLIGLFSFTWLNTKPIAKILTSKITLILIGIVLIGLTIYAYWFRPNIEPYAIMNKPGDPLDGTRDYRENSLVNLSKYLSPPVIFVAVGGWFITLWEILRKRKDLPLMVILICFTGFSIFYLWRPSIYPVHFWAVRRFTPIIIPGFILFSILGIRWIFLKLPRNISFTALIVTIIYMVHFIFSSNHLILTFSEEKGYFRQLQQLAQKLPTDSLTLAECDYASLDYGWLMPLYLAFNRQIIMMDLNSRGGLSTLYHWSVKQADEKKPIYLLYQGNVEIPGTPYEREEVVLFRSFFEHTFFPLPQKISSEKRIIGLYKITGLVNPSGYLNNVIGNKKSLGIREFGFYPQEFIGSTPVRWTNGKGILVIPIDEKRKPKEVDIDIASTGTGKSKKIKIIANGYKLFEGEIPDGGWSHTVSLAHVPLGKELILELLSDTHIPKDIIKGSSDVRKLGVFVRGIKFLDKNINYINIELGSKRFSGVRESGFHGQEFGKSGEPFRWTDGSAKLIVHLNKEQIPKGLRIDIGSTGGVKEKKLKVLANGRELFNGKIPDGGWGRVFNLSGIPLKDQIIIEIVSDTHIPKEIIKGSYDTRKLGVMIKSIQLLDHYDFKSSS